MLKINQGSYMWTYFQAFNFAMDLFLKVQYPISYIVDPMYGPRIWSQPFGFT